MKISKIFWTLLFSITFSNKLFCQDTIISIKMPVGFEKSQILLASQFLIDSAMKFNKIGTFDSIPLFFENYIYDINPPRTLIPQTHGAYISGRYEIINKITNDCLLKRILLSTNPKYRLVANRKTDLKGMYKSSYYEIPFEKLSTFELVQLRYEELQRLHSVSD